ncbi:conserved repeat domain protein [[Clostridium] bifermentans ATCC 638]|uniref:Conserved repeat domain protein n=1 Tax=Paraclostridium bifermentans ATCC 638 = DSM 14991 TaxID=1233171 RepID=T4V9Y4_PARBF|nr:SdrD B-like domain-containing protein [Paraclostridium bifermentans]EQK40519.1 conserved repeat domain protein [[Clostridium] bifermentans ATCC 638] [Paraclostridium bifermentans ATCC 638 = DSM 14991]RIZ58703.1 hypothetical protein CHH45_09805 [Paraclostridium bifermentans]UAG18145.1 hypothetical protein KXZ80_15680 [Paraclostridium bifermentans]
MEAININIEIYTNENNFNLHPEIAATVSKSVTPSTVNYEETFIYTINASFSGLGDFGPILNAYIIDLIPEDIEIITLPPVGGIIKDITTNYVPGVGTYIKFDFGSITNLGVAYVFDLECKFALSAPNNSSFVNSVDLTVTQESKVTNLSADSPPINLVAIADFEISKVKRLPIINPGPGSRLVYVIDLKNLGDKGACINNVVISDLLPSGISIDPLFPPVGEDVSPAPFQDPKYDKTLSPPFNNPVVFNLSGLGPYCGTDYRITITTLVDATISTDQIENKVNWSIDGTEQKEVTLTTDIIGAIYSSSITKFAPIYGTTVAPDNKISYALNFSNNGNQDLSNVTVIDTIPLEVTPNRLFTGRYGISSIDYLLTGTLQIDYSTDNQGTWFPVPPLTFDPAIGQWIPLPTSPKITNIRFRFSDWTSGVRPLNLPRIDGTINPSAAGSTIDNTASINWTEGPGPYSDSDTKSTILNGNASLNLRKFRVGTNAAVIPGNIITYRLIFNSGNSTINNAVLTDLLPEEVEYVSPLGTINSTYYNYFDGDGGSSQPLTYNVALTPNYMGSGRTLVTFTITSPTVFQQNSNVSIDFNVKVKVGATGVISNNGEIYASNNADPAIPFISNTVNTNISFINSLASDKKVKGALDSDYTEFPQKGKTFNGGTLEYKLTLSNTGNLNLQELEVVDIFPHVGDTGVILINDPRKSDFKVFLTDMPDITVTSTDPLMPTPTVQIQYSESYNPVRFGANNNTIGTVNDWTSIAPYPIDQVKSIKLIISGSPLKPGQSVILSIKAQVPVGIPTTDPPLVAWNSFALRGSYINQFGALTNFLPVEPEKVGITVENPVFPGKIGTFTWHDVLENGIFHPLVDNGINNATVYLYDVDPTLNPQALPIATSISNNDTLGKPGYYLFSNLPLNKTYYVKFIPPLGFEYTIQNLNPDGSKPDPSTGVVKNITLTDDNPFVLDVNAGFIDIICSVTNIKQCLYIICSDDEIEYVDTDQTFLYVSIKDYYIDKSKVVYDEYLGQIVSGYYLYATVVVEFHIHYNEDDFIQYNISYEIKIFIPEYISNDTLSLNSFTDNINFYICNSKETLLVNFDLYTCINFEQS